MYRHTREPPSVDHLHSWSLHPYPFGSPCRLLGTITGLHPWRQSTRPREWCAGSNPVAGVRDETSPTIEKCTMSTTNSRNLWYCPEARVETYRSILTNGGDPTVIQTAKVLRTILLNAMVVGLAAFSVMQGGDPSFVPVSAFATLAVVNGFEYSDWAAFRQAYHEASTEETSAHGDE